MKNTYRSLLAESEDKELSSILNWISDQLDTPSTGCSVSGTELYLDAPSDYTDEMIHWKITVSRISGT